MTAKEKIEAAGFENVVIFTNHHYDAALLGVTYCGRAVYDFDKMVKCLVDHSDLDPQKAADKIYYDIQDASPYAGEEGPLILYTL